MVGELKKASGVEVKETKRLKVVNELLKAGELADLSEIKPPYES